MNFSSMTSRLASNLRSVLNSGLKPVSFALLTLASLGLSACGYTLQSRATNHLKDIGVERVYIAPVKNLSYKPGLEHLFYNELVQALLAGKRVHLVDRPEAADAILSATVDSAVYRPSATTTAGTVFPDSVNTIDIMVATEYQTDVQSSFRLNRQESGRAGAPIWSSSYARSRRFAASNQKAEYGTTSGLINESEFDRTLRMIAHELMRDVHESMVARF
jgi:outer membrane lipopolysaccharide assembly protein LptE/RlpB